jgi:hypothetical protein
LNKPPYFIEKEAEGPEDGRWSRSQTAKNRCVNSGSSDAYFSTEIKIYIEMIRHARPRFA